MAAGSNFGELDLRVLHLAFSFSRDGVRDARRDHDQTRRANPCLPAAHAELKRSTHHNPHLPARVVVRGKGRGVASRPEEFAAKRLVTPSRDRVTLHQDKL
jgi:hypothetical protein